MAAPRGNRFACAERRGLTPIERFRSFCQFEPTTGCVVWTGGVSMGRGHHVPYGVFWFEGRRWFAHRWAAKFVHGLDIDGLQVDHCCPSEVRSLPNTLCVEHLTSETLLGNRELQAVRAFEARKRAIHLEVGLLRYEDVYGPLPGDQQPIDLVPFFSPPAWLGAQHDRHPTVAADCPF